MPLLSENGNLPCLGQVHVKGQFTLNFTVQDIIRSLTEPTGTFQSDVDGILYGRSDMIVHGVAVTFVASYEAIREAKRLGANLIISHEGLFYRHHHEPEEGRRGVNTVRDMKQDLIHSSEMTIYRFHDNPHRSEPDLITQSLLQAVKWEHFTVQHLPYAAIVELPKPLTIHDIAYEMKRCLDLPYLRLAGNRQMRCQTFGLLVGYRGGSEQTIPLYEQHQVDLVIAGEGPEWETPEYVRDALDQGKDKALLLLGHCSSEEPGMKRTAELVQKSFPQLPVHFISTRHLIEIV